MNTVRKVLILSVKAGAGHVRAAQAIEAAFREAHPAIEVKQVDALEYTNPAFRWSFHATYEKLASDLPTVWGFIYERMEKKPVTSKMKRLATLFDRVNSTRVVKEVNAFDPDRIVCTHYLPAEILAVNRRKGKLRAPLYVVLTDYDIHIMWIQEGVDGYFVATDEMAHALRAKGIGQATVSVSGIPIMPVFSQVYPDRAAMRQKLGLRPAVPTVLVAAGGFGMGGVDRTVSVLADALENVQLLAIAGRNEKLHDAVRSAAAGCPHGRRVPGVGDPCGRGGKIVPFGFVTNMHELMAACDFAVTKSGGLTSSECLAMGLPMVILSPIPGQEERNSDYLLENGAALRANSAAHLVFKAGKLLKDGALLARMASAARAIARPRAAYDIAAAVVHEQ